MDLTILGHWRIDNVNFKNRRLKTRGVTLSTFASLKLSFLTYKMGIILPTLQVYLTNYMTHSFIQLRFIESLLCGRQS